MTHYDPLYGELLDSREVAEMTGLTMNQLRNWRLPSRQEAMPFGFLKIGGSVKYRKAVVEAWLEKNGAIVPEYVQGELDKQVPLNDVLANDPAKREGLAKLAKITTRNAWTSMATWLIEQSGISNGTKVIHDEGRRLLAIERDTDPKEFGTPNADLKSTDPDAFWKIWVYGVRKGFAMVNSLDVTDEEIMRLPVGDIPPLKTD